MYQRIRDLREDRDLMQKDLAAYLKCTQVCYSNYEMGKRDIPTDVLKALAIYYDTSVDYILGLTETISENILTNQPGGDSTGLVLFLLLFRMCTLHPPDFPL